MLYIRKTAPQDNRRVTGIWLESSIIVAESLDPHTGEKEWAMQWKK